MFTFFHRKPEITVDFFTCSDFAYNFTPIKKSSKFLPDWWKKLPPPKRTNDVYPEYQFTNMKNCYGFVELYKTGFIVPHWCESKITVNRNNVVYENSNSNILPVVNHNSEHYNNAFSGYNHVKINPPWAVKEKSGVKFLYGPATWSLENYPMTIVPGVVEYSMNRSLAINMFLPKIELEYTFYIPAGQPLAQLVPLCEDKNIKNVNHLVSDEEFYKIYFGGTNSLFGKFKSMQQLKRKTEERESKCPFR